MIQPSTNGLFTCARYAFPPNALHYCGPEKQTDLAEYLRESVVDPGLKNIIESFETVFPYLKLIAEANGISDPFDERVVEAYWIGNSLLRNITPKSYVRHVAETLGMDRKIPHKHKTLLHHSVSEGLPYHTFHVLNIFVRTGHVSSPQTLHTMDECRIGWGKVTNVGDQGQYTVSVQPLAYVNESLCLGKPVEKTVTATGLTPGAGEYVSLHWYRICGILTPLQLRSLRYFTEKAIILANMKATGRSMLIKRNAKQVIEV